LAARFPNHRRGLIAQARCAICNCWNGSNNWNGNSVRYGHVNAIVLNEFLKEHRKKRQEATMAELKSQVATLFATAKEQTAQIKKASAQLELSESAPQTVLNNQ